MRITNGAVSQFMKSGEFCSKLLNHTTPFDEFVEWAFNDAAEWVGLELSGVLGSTADLMPKTEALRFGLLTTYSDVFKRSKTSKYYIAQLSMLQHQLSRYREATDKHRSLSLTDLSAVREKEIRAGVSELLLDAVVMLEKAGVFLLDLSGAYGAWRASHDFTFGVYQASEQLIYGCYSGLARQDRQTFASTSVLRTAIELRMRRTFGINLILIQGTNS